MKKLILILSLGVLVAGSSMAQQAPRKEQKNRTEQRDGRNGRERRSPEERAALRTEKMSKELGLSKSQAKKLHALNLKQAKEREEMRAQYKNANKRGKSQQREMQASREEMKASREKWNAELKEILTKKQYAKYQEQHQEMRAQSKERERGEGYKERVSRRHSQRS